MIRLIVTWFGAGDMRPASGTWGSAVAVALGVLIHWLGSFPLLALATEARCDAVIIGHQSRFLQ